MTSLRKRLLLWLLLGQVLVVLIAGFITYNQVRREVDEIMDVQLLQLALGFSDVHFPEKEAVVNGEPKNLGDDDSLIQAWGRDGRLVYSSHPQIHLPYFSNAGYSNSTWENSMWRIYVANYGNMVIQVAQPLAARREASAEVAFASVGPVLALIPLLSLLVWFGVGYALRPLQRISQALDARTPTSLSPLSLDGLPEEVQPMTAALNDLLARLNLALENQRKFVADAAHELRTPLAVVQLHAQLLERAVSAEDRRLAMNGVREGTARAVHLVGQLLVLAHQSADLPQPDFCQVELSALVRTVVGEHARKALTSGVDLGMSRDETVSIWGSEESLRVMIGNLVDNAVRYTPSGGKVDVSVYGREADAVIEILDSGCGIPAHERDRVFDRFYRCLGGDIPGSGLGLAIVKDIVDRHAGKVILADGVGEGGLLVRVEIPLG